MTLLAETWRVVVDEPQAAGEQMAVDIRAAQAALPAFRAFLWEPPAVSLGYRQVPPDWMSRGPAVSDRLERVERPTGGGLALHGSDVSVALVVPRAAGVGLHAMMSAVCDSAVWLCRIAGVEASAEVEVARRSPIAYCLTEHSPYAVFLDGRKVAGFAVRRFPDAWLVQGSLLVNALPRALAAVLPREVAEAYARRAVPLAQAAGTPLLERDIAQRWARLWPECWDARIGHAV